MRARTERRRDLGERRGSARSGLGRLVAVAAAFTLAQLVLVAPGLGLGWDEAVYVSQVSGHAPPAFFSAPRARGITFLVAPVAALTASTAALRVYLALVSGIGLFVALRVWRRLLPAGVLATAGALFAGLWVTQFYGPQAMPNLWVAFAALAAVGCFLRAATDPADRAATVGAGLAPAFAALMRPADAIWMAAPLVAATLVVRRWRRGTLLAVLVGGVALGAAPWIVEAYAHFGGVLARLHRASQIEGGLGWHVAIDDQIRSLTGRALCRPCNLPWRHPLLTAWWFALFPLAAGGVAVARRGRRAATAALPVLCGLTAAVPYLFLIDYAAPRFLLPMYALLALPVADCLLWLAADAPVRLRPLTAALVATGLAGHLAVQETLVVHVSARTRLAHGDYARAAADLRRLGVHPPCLLTGEQAIPVAFSAGCASAQTTGHDASTDLAGLLAAARREDVAVLVHRGRPPDYARSWRPRALPGLRVFPDLVAYLSLR